MTSSKKLLYEGPYSLLYLEKLKKYPNPVVLKILKKENASKQQVAQFENEYLFIKDLNIPGIRKAYEKTTQDGYFALVLEYIEGTTLKDISLTTELSISKF